ncbi:hypothetical protein PX699_28660 [Sphingobium sp. H39-3-25]|uniref:hypothetical protein n=1 Tax=Sphingobium arseniciresistens TaxID=3030834 RepID=UPI0023B9E230|nr:hypothetical protein [Sphingobium arseniciresistens]
MKSRRGDADAIGHDYMHGKIRRAAIAAGSALSPSTEETAANLPSGPNVAMLPDPAGRNPKDYFLPVDDARVARSKRNRLVDRRRTTGPSAPEDQESGAERPIRAESSLNGQVWRFGAVMTAGADRSRYRPNDRQRYYRLQAELFTAWPWTCANLVVGK